MIVPYDEEGQVGPLFFIAVLAFSMITEQALGQIRALAEEVSAREGCHVYDLEFVGHGGQRVLRVFIDGQVEGVSIDQCANVSRGLSLLLDVEDLIPGGHYELEVSSPGLERPLRAKWHYEKVAGKTIKVKTKEFVDFPGGELVSGKKRPPVKSLQGKLLGTTDDLIRVEAEGVEWQIPYNNIHKANLVFEVNKPSKAKNKKR